MPIIRYICNCGESVGKFHRAGASAPAFLPCKCGMEMKRTMQGPSQGSKIVIDNGVQARAIEINVDVIKSDTDRNAIKEKMRNKP